MVGRGFLDGSESLKSICRLQHLIESEAGVSKRTLDDLPHHCGIIDDQHLHAPRSSKPDYRGCIGMGNGRHETVKESTDQPKPEQYQEDRISMALYGKGTNFAAQPGKTPLTSLPFTVESSPINTRLTGPGPRVRSEWLACAL